MVTGHFSGDGGTATFGPGETNETVLTSEAGYDIFVAKYAPDGSLIWAVRAGGNGNAYGYGITSLPDGSIVVSGHFSRAATFGPGEANETVLTSEGDDDIFIARFAP